MSALALADPDALAESVAEIMLDLPSFGGLVQIKTKSDGKVPFGFEQWHPEQLRFERERTGRDIVLKPRQIGFSTMELLRDLQFARTHEGAQVVVVVHTGEAKNELFSAIHLMNRCLSGLGLVPPAKENTKTGLRWDDIDSSIKIIEAGKDEGTAAARGRSGTIHRLHVTEAAFYAQPEETLTALFAAAENGEVVIESTANGLGNWFHEHVQLAREGRFEDFKFHFFAWHEHPHYRATPGAYPAPISKREQFWEAELRKLGCDEGQIAWWRRQVSKYKLDKALREYPPTADAAFTESGAKWLAPEYIDRLRGHIREPIETIEYEHAGKKLGALRVYERPEQGLAYIVAGDPSEGIGTNEAAAVVIEHRTGRVVACWHDTRTDPSDFGRVLARIGRLYNTALVAPERNRWNHGRDGGADSEGGRQTIRVLQRDERYPRIYRDDSDKLGWVTTKQSRALIFGDLKMGIEDDELHTPDAKTVAEAASIIGGDGPPRVPKKKQGRGDDGLFISWGIALQVRQSAPLPGRTRIEPVGSQLVSAGFRT